MLITLKAVFLLVATVVVAGNDLGIAVVVHGILNRFVGRVHGLGCSDNLGCTGVFRFGWKGILLVTHLVVLWTCVVVVVVKQFLVRQHRTSLRQR